jgi:acetyl esterase/lipase
VQGDKDPLVPTEQSRELSEKLKDAGAEQELVIVEGAGHGFMGDNAKTEGKRVREFFIKWLKPTKAPPEAPDTKKKTVGWERGRSRLGERWGVAGNWLEAQYRTM